MYSGLLRNDLGNHQAHALNVDNNETKMYVKLPICLNCTHTTIEEVYKSFTQEGFGKLLK